MGQQMPNLHEIQFSSASIYRPYFIALALIGAKIVVGGGGGRFCPPCSVC